MSEPGWYPDPVDPASLRWFDGAAWSKFQRPVGADLLAPLTNLPTASVPVVNIPPQPQSPQSATVVPAQATASKVWIAVVAAAVTVVVGGGVVLAAAAALGGSDSIEASPASAQRKASDSSADPTTVAPTTVPPAAAPDTVPPTAPAPPPTAPPPTAPPQTEPPQLTAPSWDELKNASIPEHCGHPATQLVDGKDQSLGPNDGFFELMPSLYSGKTGILQGVPSSDAGPLTAVVVSCNGGGVGWPNSVMFFSSGGQYYAVGDLYEGLGWEAEGMSGPGREGIISISLSGDQVQVHTSATTLQDAECCPSTTAVLSLRASGGRIIQSDLFNDFGH
jgi:hypothetical protein